MKRHIVRSCRRGVTFLLAAVMCLTMAAGAAPEQELVEQIVQTEQVEQPEQTEQVKQPEQTEQVKQPEQTEQVKQPEQTEQVEQPEQTEQVEHLEQTQPRTAIHEIDASTKGNWIGTYGGDGAYFFGYNATVDLDKLPSYVTNFTASATGRNGRWVFGSGENLAEGLPLTSNESGNRVNSVLFADEAIEISFDIPVGISRQVAIYQVGDAAHARVNGITCVSRGQNPENILPEEVLVDKFAGGKYVVFPVDRPCVITITSRNPAVGGGNNVNNAVVNAIFFETKAEDAVVEDITIYPEDGQNTRFQLDSFQMKATIQPVAAAGAEIAWAIQEDENGEDPVATVDNTGLVTVQRAGTFTVTATAEEQTATSAFLVLEGGAVEGKTTLTRHGEFVLLENAQIRFLFDCKSGTYSIYKQESNLPYVLNASTQVNDLKSTEGYSFSCVDVTEQTPVDRDTSYEQPETKFSGKTIRLMGEKANSVGMVLEVSLADSKGSLVMANGIVNNTGEGLKLMQMYPLVAKATQGGGIFAGPNPAENHDVMTGDGDWKAPEVYGGVTTTTKNVATISYRDEAVGGLETFLLGGLTTYEFQNEVKTSNPGAAAVENSGRKSIDASIRVFDFTGKLVDDGQTYVADKVFLNFTEQNPYYALEDYGHEYADAMNVNLVCYNDYVSTCLWYVDWYLKGANNADYGVKQAQAMMKTGMGNYAPPLIRLVPDTYSSPNEQLWWDDEHWKAFGHLTDSYPTLKAFGDGVRAAGGVPGMYMQPTYPNKDYNAAHTDHMIDNTYLSGPDYTDPDFITHMEGVYENMKAAGIVSNFYDYTYMFMKQDDALQKPVKETNILELTGGFEDEYATAVSAYRNIYKIPKTVYPEMALTENPWYSVGQSVAIGLIDSQRSVLDANHFDSRIARTGITQWFRNEVTKLVDPDVKVFDMEDTDHRRAEITGTGLMFGKTMFGRPVEDYDQQCIQDIGRIYPMPIDGVTARPVGLFEMGNKNPYLYDYVFDSTHDDHVLLMWNYDGSNSRDITAELGKDVAYGGIGLDATKEYDVWDFWDWRYIGRVSGGEDLTLSVRPNEMKTLAVREVDETRILSTNRHVLQGEVDTAGVSYNAVSRTLTGTLKAVADDTYRAILMLPDQNDKIKTFRTDLTNGTATAKKNGFGYVEITIDVPGNTDIHFTLELEEGVPEEDTQAPSLPWNLRAEVNKNGQPELAWEESKDNSGSVEYRIYRCREADETLNESNLVAVSGSTQYRDTRRIEVNQLYVYCVIAVDPSGNQSVPATVKLVLPPEEVQNDGSTGGKNWSGSYGADGHVFFNKLHDKKDVKTLPTYISNVTYQAAGQWQFTRSDAAAFQFGGKNYMGCLYDANKIVLTVTATDSNPHSITLYSADGDGNGARAHKVEAYAVAGGEKIAEKTVEKYQNGIYTSFNFTGSIRIELIKTGGVNAVLSAVFFDAAREIEPIEVPNSAPYAVGISESTVSRQASVGTTVGTLTTMDADRTDTFTYEVKGESSYFAIEGDRLVTKASLSGAQSTELVEVQATDAAGAVCAATLEIAVQGSGSSGESGGSYAPSRPSATVNDKEGGAVEIKDDGTAAIQVNEGWRIKSVTVNGISRGRVARLFGLKPGDKVQVMFERKPAETVVVSELFTDVPADAWYTGAAQFVVEEGLFSGTSATTFTPGGLTTRAMLWNALARLDGHDTEGGATWYEKAAQWAVARKISDGTVPEGGSTREQTVTLLWRYAGSPVAKGGLDGYTDRERVSDWAQAAFAWAVEMKIISGTSAQTLEPSRCITRGETATILQRYCEGVSP